MQFSETPFIRKSSVIVFEKKYLVSFADLFTGQLGLEFRKPIAQLLHMRIEENCQLKNVSPLLHSPGKAADVSL